ncbi:unnamed protein product [Camellia sinensis]
MITSVLQDQKSISKPLPHSHPNSITVIFFAKESEDCSLTTTRENLIKPVTMHFKQGLGQKFIQPSRTGIDFSMFDERELLAEGDMEVYPLAVKAEASPVSQNESTDENPEFGTTNSQITKVVFENEKGEYKVRLVKQILWVHGMRYELQKIYEIGNSVNGDFDGNDFGKECVVCLSEPRDTTVLPCRHMGVRLMVQSDWKAHSKTCGTKEYICDCGTLFSSGYNVRKEGYVVTWFVCSHGACLAQNAKKWSECIKEICTFHELPFPTDDERFPVGMGSNPVYLIADHVIKLYVEDSLEVSLHALGAEWCTRWTRVG